MSAFSPAWKLGGYVGNTEVFAATLMGVAIADADVAAFAGLSGVQQIALGGTHASFASLQALARIPGLASLVLCNSPISDSELHALEAAGPAIGLIPAG
jgi:hypothetical protein